jgi:nitrogen fixation protein FixH
MRNQAETLNTPAWKSPWVIGWTASIFVVLGVNLFMVYLAVDTNPGLVVEDYYERGQDYERTLFAERAKDPGWHMTVNLPKTVTAGSVTPVHFSVLDKAGVPVEPDSVIFYAYRPSDATQDFSVPMAKEAMGMYSAKAQFGLKGAWDILASVRTGEDEYHVGRRIDVAASN